MTYKLINENWKRIINHNMPDEFFDWLNKCPVQWLLGQWDNDSISYTFNVPDEENENEKEGE